LITNSAYYIYFTAKDWHSLSLQIFFIKPITFSFYKIVAVQEPNRAIMTETVRYGSKSAISYHWQGCR